MSGGITRAADVPLLQVQRRRKQALATTEVSLRTMRTTTLSLWLNRAPPKLAVVDQEGQLNPSSIPPLPANWWRLPPEEEAAEIADLYGPSFVPLEWWQLSPEANAAECADLYPDLTPKSLAALAQTDIPVLPSRSACEQSGKISKQVFLTRYFHLQATRSSNPSCSFPKAVPHGELGSRQQRSPSPPEAPHRSWRGGGPGASQAARSVSGRVGTDDSFHSPGSRRGSAPYLDVTGIHNVCRSGNPCRQGVPRSRQSSRPRTWLGQSTPPCMGITHHDGEERQQPPAGREGSNHGTCQLRYGPQGFGDPGYCLQHPPGLQQGMGARTVQGESRNRADCKDHRECFPQSRGRAEVRYRPNGPP